MKRNRLVQRVTPVPYLIHMPRLSPWDEIKKVVSSSSH